MGNYNSNKVAGKKGNKCKNKKKAAFKKWEHKVEELAAALVVNERTSELLDPHLKVLGDIKEVAAFLKIIAALLMADPDVREEILDEVLPEDKEFLQMYVETLDAIIMEEVDNFEREE